MKRCVSSLILVLVVAICSSEIAGAEPRSEAAKSFARGKKLFAKRDYTGAIAAFERAYSLRPHHAVQCSIAHCYEQLNRFVESAEHYRRCLKEGASSTKTAKQVQRSLEEVETRISWVEVQSPGRGGAVHVNGVLQGATPRRVPLNPGRHLIEVRRSGAKPATLSVKVLSGEERTVSLVPTTEARSEAAPKVTAHTKVTVEKPVERPAPRRGLTSAWFWTSAALTVALAAAAGTMGGLTYKAHEDYYDSPTKQGYDTFVTRRLITNILAGCAVAAGGTSTVLFFYTDFGGGSDKEAKTAVVLGLRGTF